ncbi:unnamed protein product, partial [Meganyctiphanes norvegica]
MSSFPFCVEYDKRGAAGCKKCKQKITKGLCRIGKIVPNHFSDSGGDMKQWHHMECIFEVLKKARATTKVIEDAQDDLEGWENIEEDEKKKIRDLIDELAQLRASKATPKKATPKKAATPKATNSTPKINAGTSTPKTTPQKPKESPSTEEVKKVTEYKGDINHKDNSFREFRRICANIADEPGYLNKTEILSRWLKKGSSGDGFEGDLCVWIRLLLPGVVKRVYNLQSKQLVKLFSQLFGTNQEEMMEDLENGDIAETIRLFFEKSKIQQPLKKACLTLHKVDALLLELSKMSKEEEQSYVLKKAAQLSTANDLKMFIRIIKGDLRINAGAKHILEAVHPDAYTAFQTTRNIEDVIDQVLRQAASGGSSLNMSARVMTPVLPMLAEACKSVDMAFKKCPNGMYSEIKYDGERVQVHKIGDEFKYFSRSLKPVMPHKVSHFKNYIPQAFPNANDLILDAEVLLIDTQTGNPLPFGTLGVHKKSAFQDASVCLFIFDCLHMNDKSLMEKPIVERRRILESTMVEVKNHIMFSEYKLIKKKADLADMIQHVLKQGLEGLVLKDLLSVYEPGKRHWLKVKKDYLNDGAMADTADLVVLGGWYGTGKKGGIMSSFLMGCHDPHSNKWVTVSKVSGGHDDAALTRLQKELEMDKISQDPELVPSWLKCTKSMIPDFISKDPKHNISWEIKKGECGPLLLRSHKSLNMTSIRVKNGTKRPLKLRPKLVYKATLYHEILESGKLMSHTELCGHEKMGGSRGGTSTPLKGISWAQDKKNPTTQTILRNKQQKYDSRLTEAERVMTNLSIDAENNKRKETLFDPRERIWAEVRARNACGDKAAYTRRDKPYKLKIGHKPNGLQWRAKQTQSQKQKNQPSNKDEIFGEISQENTTQHKLTPPPLSHKPDKPPELPESYRPIALLQCTSKLMEPMVTLVVFFDLKASYDSVDHMHLLHKLAESYSLEQAEQLMQEAIERFYEWTQEKGLQIN